MDETVEMQADGFSDREGSSDTAATKAFPLPDEGDDDDEEVGAAAGVGFSGSELSRLWLWRFLSLQPRWSAVATEGAFSRQGEEGRRYCAGERRLVSWGCCGEDGRAAVRFNVEETGLRPEKDWRCGERSG